LKNQRNQKNQYNQRFRRHSEKKITKTLDKSFHNLLSIILISFFTKQKYDSPERKDITLMRFSANFMKKKPDFFNKIRYFLRKKELRPDSVRFGKALSLFYAGHSP